MASAGPYASLHLAPDRQPRQYTTTLFFTGRMPFLPPKQQRQSTEGTFPVTQLQNKTVRQLHLCYWLTFQICTLLQNNSITRNTTVRSLNTSVYHFWQSVDKDMVYVQINSTVLHGKRIHYLLTAYTYTFFFFHLFQTRQHQVNIKLNQNSLSAELLMI